MNMQMGPLKIQTGLVLAAALLCTFIPVMILEMQAHQLNGSFIYPVDDTFIHMQLARNIALNSTWGINSHEFSSASSSLLYTLLLASLFRIFSGSMILPLVVNSIAAIILLYSIHQWLIKQQLNVWWHLVVLLAVVFFTPLPIMVISGMEHTLQCLFSFLFLFHGADWIATRMQQPDSNRHVPWNLLIYACLVTAIRYEGLFLVAVFCLALLYFKQTRWAFLIGSAGLLPVVLFGIYSLSKGSYFLPNSVLIKSEEVSLFGNGVSHFFTTLLVDKLTLMKPGITLLATQRLLLLLPLTYLMLQNNRPLNSYSLIVVLLFAVVILHLGLAATGKFYRYEAYLILCSILIISTASVQNVGVYFHSTTFLTRIVSFLFLFFLLMPVVLRSTAAFSKARQACINIYEQQYQMASFLRSYYPSTTIAANDIGAVSFFTKCEVIDLWGLGSIEVTKSRKNNVWSAHFLDSFSRKRNTKLAIIYDSWFHPTPGNFWTKIGSWKIENNVVCGDDMVCFYAIDSTIVNEMKNNFRSYSRDKLPRTVQVTYY